jgi:hypothetical protein
MKLRNLEKVVFVMKLFSALQLVFITPIQWWVPLGFSLPLVLAKFGTIVKL